MWVKSVHRIQARPRPLCATSGHRRPPAEQTT